MVSGYTSFKEGFATTPTATEDITADKIAEITANIKDLEEALKLKKDELVSEVKKQVKTETTLSVEDEEVMYEDEAIEDTESNEVMESESDLIDAEEVMENEASEEVMEDEDIIEEGFAGSIIVSKSYLTDLLKAILLALVFYVLTSKDMQGITKPIHNAVKDVVSHNVLHTLIFLVVAFGIIAFTM